MAKAKRKRRGHIAFDYDGTLAKQPGHKPVRKMVEKAKRAVKAGKNVKVLSARAGSKAGRKKIRDFTERHIGKRLHATNKKTPGMKLLYDDRAVKVHKDRGTTKRRTR